MAFKKSRRKIKTVFQCRDFSPSQNITEHLSTTIYSAYLLNYSVIIIL